MTNEAGIIYVALVGGCAITAIGVTAYIIHELNKRDIEHSLRTEARAIERLRIAEIEADEITERERALAQRTSALLSEVAANERKLLLSNENQDDNSKSRSKLNSIFKNPLLTVFGKHASMTSSDDNLAIDIEHGFVTLNETLDVIDQLQQQEAERIKTETENRSTFRYQ